MAYHQPMLAGRPMLMKECSKRVYQGVRVKHTVKDLLAEKRSRETSGPRYTGVSSPPLVQMTGSHMLPSYYGMRRPFISDTEFCSSMKPFSTDVYPSSLTGKSLSCDTGCVSGYSSLIDSYYPESFGDYRSTPFSSGGSAIFSPSALSSLLPPYSSDPSHYLLRDSWEPTGTEVVEGLCGDGLAPMPLSTPSSLVNPETASPTQFRSSSRMTSSQSYSLHSLEEVNYHSSFQSSSGSFAPPSFLTEPATKLVPVLPSEDTESAPSALSDSLVWGKEDTGSTWAQYEVRRTF
ncbi:POU class 2 homeobox associating-factor 2 isoform X1 [Rhinichthys klamathensis goyatoka]|uniref:POU class 2 homeobox associating-factor 2 isoform X1 n=1 Tax=Rhinichthys klamathensis goyatoka TaxID=3034132 RepID=UPI0024B5E846|nr:POU class 2 homeobox associating-factor 2 isoform X1 [Rhinichthys klamathensis goyatoka]